MLGSRSLASATEERDKASVVMGVDGAGEGREERMHGCGRGWGGKREGREMGGAWVRQNVVARVERSCVADMLVTRRWFCSMLGGSTF